MCNEKYSRHVNPLSEANRVGASSFIDFPLNRKNPVVEMDESAVKSKTKRFLLLNTDDHLRSIDCAGTTPNNSKIS